MTPVWSPEAINDLIALRAYIEQDDPAAAQRVALHIVRNVETLLPNNPRSGDLAEFRDARTRDPENALYRSVPSGWQHGPDPAHLPRASSMARGTLKGSIDRHGSRAST
jgi:plasmid stabilization system protein ParE